jgi:hypothetical protein
MSLHPGSVMQSAGSQVWMFLPGLVLQLPNDEPIGIAVAKALPSPRDSRVALGIVVAYRDAGRVLHQLMVDVELHRKRLTSVCTYSFTEAISQIWVV